jgi:hypothetical protein
VRPLLDAGHVLHPGDELGVLLRRNDPVLA